MPDPSKIVRINTTSLPSIATRPRPARPPRKKALLIGVQYSENTGKLQSTYADVESISALLIDIFKYDKDDITIMQDDKHHVHPTHDNILKAIDDFTRDAQDGDRFVFHFSGHGSQKPELVKGSEKDHFDEAIWPSDVDRNLSNIILDNDIRSRLVNKLPKGTRLVAIFDCCHSGTAADLRHSHSDHHSGVVDIVMRTAALKLFHPTTLEIPVRDEEDVLSPFSAISPVNAGLARGDPPATVVSWAACRDPQETHSKPRKGGMFTQSFVSAIRTLLEGTRVPRDQVTHGRLLHFVNRSMNIQTTCLRRLLHAAEVNSADRRQATPRSYDAICRELIAPRPQLGTMRDFRETLDTPLLDMFEFAH